MKTVSKHFRTFLIPFGFFLCLNCSATNPAVEELHSKSLELQKQKINLEKKYINILGHLQRFPNERSLRLQQAELKSEISALNVQIKDNREQLNLSIKQWEDAVSEKRSEELMIRNEEQEQNTPARRRMHKNLP